MGKWIDNKYVEDAEGEARCGFSRSYFCGYENKTEFCRNNNMTRTTLEKILIILKQQFKDITLENILQEQANLSPQAVQLTQMEDAEEKKEEKKEEKYDKRKNNGRMPQPFLGYSSLTEFCKKNHTFIPTVKKIIQQLESRSIEITEENIFKQRDLNRHNTQAFRKDRPNTDIKQISTVPDTEKANSESQESREPPVKIEEIEAVKKMKEITKNDNREKYTGNNDKASVLVKPEVLDSLLESHIERQVQEMVHNMKLVKIIECLSVFYTILSGVAIGVLLGLLFLLKVGALNITINI